jgi:anti-anti-sigma factor
MFARHPVISVTTFVEPFGEDDVGNALFLIRKHVRFGRRLHIIDLDGLRAFSSDVRRALNLSVQWVRQYNGDVRLVCTHPTIRRALEQSGYDRFVDVHASVDDAIGAFREQRPKAG